MSNFQFNIGARSRGSPGIASKIFASLILCIFFVVGCGLTVVIAKQVAKNLATHQWTPVGCTIQKTGAIEKSPYKFTVTYAYQINGQSHTGATLYPDYTGSTDYYPVQTLLDEYPKNSHATCYVNPQNAADSTLRLRSLWTVLQILFPLVFVAIGAGGMYLMWRKQAAPSPDVQLRHPKVIGGLFFGVFFAAGAAVACFFVPILLRGRAAQSWPQFPCVIASSNVESHTSSSRHGSSTTYGVAVLYHFKIGSKRYGSSHYSLNNSSSSDYSAAQRVVDTFPKGKKTICYVNPLDPADAVLERSYGTVLYLTGFLSTVFMLVGAGGIGAIVRAARNEHRQLLEEHLAPNQRQSARLRPSVSPGMAVAGPILMALVWNGLIGCIDNVLISQWHSGQDLLTGPIIIATILSVTGIGLIVLAIINMRKLFAPRLEMTLSRHPLILGEPDELRWNFTRAAERVTQLKLRAAGYFIDRTVVGPADLKNLTPFWSQDMIDTTRPAEIQAGRVTFTIPPTAYPANIPAISKLRWTILAELPGTAVDYPIHVVPPEI